MPVHSGIDEAIQIAGGSAGKLAALIGGKVVRQNVEYWQKVGRVPMAQCPRISAATGVSLERLNPDADWDLIRAPRRTRKPGVRSA